MDLVDERIVKHRHNREVERAREIFFGIDQSSPSFYITMDVRFFEV